MGEARGKMSGSGDFFGGFVGDWFSGTGIRMDDSMMPKKCGWFFFSTRNRMVFGVGMIFRFQEVDSRSGFPIERSQRGWLLHLRPRLSARGGLIGRYYRTPGCSEGVKGGSDFSGTKGE